MLLGLSLAWVVSDSRADAPTRMILHNGNASRTRVQVSLGPAFPCDSSDNRMMFDDILSAGETREIAVEMAITVCARNTTPGSTLEWQPSHWYTGGQHCRGGRGGTCSRDASVPIYFDVAP